MSLAMLGVIATGNFADMALISAILFEGINPNSDSSLAERSDRVRRLWTRFLTTFMVCL